MTGFTAKQLEVSRELLGIDSEDWDDVYEKVSKIFVEDRQFDILVSLGNHFITKKVLPRHPEINIPIAVMVWAFGMAQLADNIDDTCMEMLRLNKIKVDHDLSNLWDVLRKDGS